MRQIEPSAMAFVATKFPNTAVHLKYCLAACALVQSIDILGDKSEMRNTVFEFNQGKVARIGLRVVNQPTTPAIPFPN